MAKSFNQITILGTGTSTGIPTIGCQCKVCTSTNPKNKRFRTSIYLETAHGKKILVDTTPDLRSQLLQNHINGVDAAIITHDHADHVHGIDDLRPFCFKDNKTIPIYTSRYFIDQLTNRFPYIFSDAVYSEERPVLGGGIPRLSLREIFLDNPLNKILDEEFRFFYVPHGYGQTLAFIHGKFGYIIDCHEIPADIVQIFKAAKLEILILDCLKKNPHQTHLTLSQTQNYLEQIDAQFTGLIHMAHDFDHEELTQEMQQKYGKKVAPLFDTQKLEYSSI